MNDNYDVIRETAVERTIKHLANFKKDEVVRFKTPYGYKFGIITKIKYNDKLDRIEYDIIANNNVCGYNIPEFLIHKLCITESISMAQNNTELPYVAPF